LVKLHQVNARRLKLDGVCVRNRQKSPYKRPFPADIFFSI